MTDICPFWPQFHKRQNGTHHSKALRIEIEWVESAAEHQILRMSVPKLRKIDQGNAIDSRHEALQQANHSSSDFPYKFGTTKRSRPSSWRFRKVDNGGEEEKVC